MGTKDKFETYQNVFDDFTERNLFKLISQRHFDGIESPIFIGKESNVFSARKDGKKVIIKIYRLETCDFNKMYDYIKYDPRYLTLRKQKRKVIFSWTQREYRNLLIAREAGVRVPTPYVCNNNIIVMEMIGGPAPQLKDSIPEDDDKALEFFEEIVRMMRKLYLAGLVHADLSAFNILNLNGRPVFIDFSQSSPITSPQGAEYLKRDIKNVCNFFNKYGIEADEKATWNRIVKKSGKKSGRKTGMKTDMNAVKG